MQGGSQPKVMAMKIINSLKIGSKVIFQEAAK